MAMPDAMEFVGKDGDYDYGDVHPNPNAAQQQKQEQQEQTVTVEEHQHQTVVQMVPVSGATVVAGGGPVTVALPTQTVRRS